MIEKNNRVNNEFYIAPVFNEAIEDSKQIKNYTIYDMKSMGTPTELKSFLEWVETKKLSLHLNDVMLNYNKHLKERKVLNNRKFQIGATNDIFSKCGYSTHHFHHLP